MWENHSPTSSFIFPHSPATAFSSLIHSLLKTLNDIINVETIQAMQILE